jgi:glycosyltransferase involved in cell wall biosynthesis
LSDSLAVLKKENLTASTDLSPQFTILIPCLNEEKTLGVCIEKAWQGLKNAGVEGEVLIADNGSDDSSVEIAMKRGCNVIHVNEKGYGSALMEGIRNASGDFVIMGDADDSYDFLEIPKFVEALTDGAEFVQGCRFGIGGGEIRRGAMPFLHQWWGNPMFSFLARSWFGSPVHDIYCGMRGFRKDSQQALRQKCTGMEFAVEMMIKASLSKARITEVPITLHPDGRDGRPPHLRTFQDGWRTLRFFLMCSPKWLFLIPGLLLILLGMLGAGLAIPGVRIGPATFDVHTLLFASLGFLLGYQAIFFALMAKSFAIAEGFVPEDAKFTEFFHFATLERGLVFGLIVALAGSLMLLTEALLWIHGGFGPLDYSRTMKWVIPGATLTALGFQTVFFSFLVSMLGISRK